MTRPEQGLRTQRLLLWISPRTPVLHLSGSYAYISLELTLSLSLSYNLYDFDNLITLSLLEVVHGLHLAGIT